MTDRSVDSLVGTPWSDMHCGQLAWTALNAMGVRVPRSALWLRDEIDDASKRMEEVAQDGRWTEADGDDVPGDVILSRAPAASGCGLHIAVSIGAGWALTTTMASGAIKVRAGNIRAVMGRYRWTA